MLAVGRTSRGMGGCSPMSGNEDDLRAKLQERSTEDLGRSYASTTIRSGGRKSSKSRDPSSLAVASSRTISRLPGGCSRSRRRLTQSRRGGRPWIRPTSTASQTASGLGRPSKSVKFCRVRGFLIVFVEQYRGGLDCYVPSARGAEARGLLEAAGLIPAQPRETSSDVFCTVCGTELPAAGSECPACASWSD
jgi:hypothetical protein